METIVWENCPTLWEMTHKPIQEDEPIWILTHVPPELPWVIRVKDRVDHPWQFADAGSQRRHSGRIGSRSAPDPVPSIRDLEAEFLAHEATHEHRQRRQAIQRGLGYGHIIV